MIFSHIPSGSPFASVSNLLSLISFFPFIVCVFACARALQHMQMSPRANRLGMTWTHRQPCFYSYLLSTLAWASYLIHHYSQPAAVIPQSQLGALIQREGKAKEMLLFLAVFRAWHICWLECFSTVNTSCLTLRINFHLSNIQRRQNDLWCNPILNARPLVHGLLHPTCCQGKQGNIQYIPPWKQVRRER